VKSTQHSKHIPVGTYHENDSLLLQFILSEFLLVYQEISSLHSHFEGFQTAISKRRPKEQRQDFLDQLIASVELLSGASHDTMRLFSWGQEGGLLHKLNSYSALFSRRSAPNGKLEQTLYRHINQCLLISIQFHDLLLTVNEFPSSQWKNYIEELEALESKIISNGEKFSKLLPKIIQRFSEDENVIFFVLRHCKEFDQLFHEGFVKKILSKLDHGTLNDVEKYLVKQYRKRGFTQLLSVISEKFENLKSV
jgi:hypothetical protein